ncbi:MAG: class E sortase [Candidatus Andersenbacteria bacterium]
MHDQIETMEYVDDLSYAYVPPGAVQAPATPPAEVVATPPAPRKSIPLFIGTFVSAFALIFGLVVGGLMVAPVVANFFIYADNEYFPQLPISEAREEGFFNIAENRGKQLYPPLTSTENAEAGNWIRIPSIDVHVPLVQSPSLEDSDVLATLDHGAALYPNGILPGHLGNTFVAAHSTGEPWKGLYRFAFLRVNELESGNIIHLDHNGTRYTYRIFNKEVVTPTPEFRVISDRPVPTMSLMACWPLWSTQKRMLVHAELQNVTQLTAPALNGV